MPSTKGRTVEFQVHFRGVAVYVANSKPGFVTEVLFPKADEEPTQLDASDLKEKSANKSGSLKMHHADGSDAIPHFAGALIIRNGVEEHRDLSGKNVQLATSVGTGAEMDSDFLENVPSLDDIITKPKKKLKLLKKTKNEKRVATRFVISGSEDDTVTSQCNAGGGWQFTEKENGSTDDPVDYTLEVLWTINADSPLIFEITDLKTGNAGTPIKLDNPSTELYFYNFDIKDPTKKQLLEVKDAILGTIDHDFKWMYKLFEKQPATWKEWLNGKHFPAPELVQAPAVSVSTCFELVWTGESDL